MFWSMDSSHRYHFTEVQKGFVALQKTAQFCPLYCLAQKALNQPLVTIQHNLQHIPLALTSNPEFLAWGFWDPCNLECTKHQGTIANSYTKISNYTQVM